MLDVRSPVFGCNSNHLGVASPDMVCNVPGSETRLNKLGISPQKLAVLWICRDYRGIVSIAEIARFCDSRSQSMVGLVKRMEEQGLVSRIPKRKGHPFTEIKLTAKGEEACRVGVAAAKALVTETAPVLSAEERHQLHKLLAAMRQQIVDDMRLELTPPPDLLTQEPITVSW